MRQNSWIKRLTGMGFWLGVLCACVPLFMYLFGNARQWQLQHQWTTTLSSPDRTPGGSASAALDTDDGLVRLQIPKIHLKDAMVVGDISNAALAQGPGHFPHTAMPGEPGNCAIAAHRNVWGCWFANLDQLTPGDKVVLETRRRHYFYRVTGSQVVEPDDLSILEPHGEKSELTLVTCTLPASRRIVVSCILDHSSVG